MANYQGIPSSFFMFCYGDSSKIDIPKAFAKKHKEFLQQGRLQLKTSSTRSWNVEIIKSRSDDGVFQIKDGWSKFAHDNDLVEMDFLTFRIIGPTSLHVSIFREDFCLEDPSLPTPSPPSSTSIQPVQTWRLVKALKHHNISQRLDIPSPFVEGTGIAAKPTILLRNAAGEEKEVAMTSRSNTKYSFTRGWSQFVNDNRFTTGDILLFEFVGDNVIEVVAVEREVGRNLIARSKRGGFLNPYLVL